MDPITQPQRVLADNLRHTLFSWSPQSGLNPLNIHYAKGENLYDRDGKSYLDFSSQLMNVNIGHGDPRVAAAVQRQMEEVSYVYPGAVTEVRGVLGKKLAEISPGSLNKVFFTLAGADAIENAIKFARLYTGRHKVVALYRSYHGATFGAISASGDPRRHPVDSQAMPGIVHVENPYYYRCPWESDSPEACARLAADHMQRVIEYEDPGSVAAIILEGESGSSGCIKYPPGYWQRVREIADHFGILLIDDEVMSGFGRTGKWFGVDHHGVVPDIMCMAKGLTSGYIPLGGIMVKDELAEFFAKKPMPLGLTYSAHAVGCAAGLAVLQVMEDDGLVENAARMGAYLESKIPAMMEKHPSIGDFRNTGLLGCFELVKNRETREPVTPWNAKPADMEATNRMAAKIRELGMFTFVRWNYIFTAPPLMITESRIDDGLEIISEAISIADEYVV
jgi:taurine--2-oxoglutarate transaminase